MKMKMLNLRRLTLKVVQNQNQKLRFLNGSFQLLPVQKDKIILGRRFCSSSTVESVRFASSTVVGSGTSSSTNKGTAEYYEEVYRKAVEKAEKNEVPEPDLENRESTLFYLDKWRLGPFKLVGAAFKETDSIGRIWRILKVPEAVGQRDGFASIVARIGMASPEERNEFYKTIISATLAAQKAKSAGMAFIVYWLNNTNLEKDCLQELIAEIANNQVAFATHKFSSVISKIAFRQASPDNRTLFYKNFVEKDFAGFAAKNFAQSQEGCFFLKDLYEGTNDQEILKKITDAVQANISVFSRNEKANSLLQSLVLKPARLNKKKKSKLPAEIEKPHAKLLAKDFLAMKDSQVLKVLARGDGCLVVNTMLKDPSLNDADKEHFVRKLVPFVDFLVKQRGGGVNVLLSLIELLEKTKDETGAALENIDLILALAISKWEDLVCTAVGAVLLCRVLTRGSKMRENELLHILGENLTTVIAKDPKGYVFRTFLRRSSVEDRQRAFSALPGPDDLRPELLVHIGPSLNKLREYMHTVSDPEQKQKLSKLFYAVVEYLPDIVEDRSASLEMDDVIESCTADEFDYLCGIVRKNLQKMLKNESSRYELVRIFRAAPMKNLKQLLEDLINLLKDNPQLVTQRSLHHFLDDFLKIDYHPHNAVKEEISLYLLKNFQHLYTENLNEVGRYVIRQVLHYENLKHISNISVLDCLLSNNLVEPLMKMNAPWGVHALLRLVRPMPSLRNNRDAERTFFDQVVKVSKIIIQIGEESKAKDEVNDAVFERVEAVINDIALSCPREIIDEMLEGIAAGYNRKSDADRDLIKPLVNVLYDNATDLGKNKIKI